MKKNMQVSLEKSSEVLRPRDLSESLQEMPQHVPTEKPAKTATAKKKRLAPPALATLINLINQVPDGLPSLEDLHDTAHGHLDKKDKLVFQIIEQRAPALLMKLPPLPDMSDPRSRLPWIVRGIDDCSRAQLYYRYDYMVIGRETLCAIADTDGGCVGVFHLATHLHIDAAGKLEVDPHPILDILKGAERKRIRRCPICAKIYWAERDDQPTCSKKCNNVRRSRIQRGTFQKS
jgi:hypothetical protein